MHFKSLLSVALGAASVSAQSLTEVLAEQNDTLSLLTNLITASPGLAEILGNAENITILAPNNDALQSFLNSTAGVAAQANPDQVAALLLYHVLNGTYPASAITNETVFVPTSLTNETYTNVTGGQVVGARLDGEDVIFYSGLLQSSTVVTADVNFTGGVIHVIDTVLTLPASDSATAGAANLTSLAGALNRTNLIPVVDALEDVTIFAPSNEAFAAISSAAGNITDEDLAEILQYHVIQGSVVYSSDIENGTSVATLNGANITITVVDGEVYVNSARVITPDVLVANGVVHVIDGVLNPDNSTATPNPTTTEPAFPGAGTATDGSSPFTSDAAPPTTTITNVPTETGADEGAATETSVAGGVRVMPTGAIGVGALFGGAMVFAANL